MSIRLKFIAVSLLLCVAIACTIFAAAGTVQAYQKFQQNHLRIIARDVQTVNAWMTIPYIERIYRVPAACLDGVLHITDPALQKHATLSYIADVQKKPVDKLIRAVQDAILAYRKHRLICIAPRAEPIPKPDPPPTPRGTAGGGE